MRLKQGMMLDFINFGHGLIVCINDRYESKITKHQLDSDPRLMLTNRYECEVLIESTLYEMSIVIHWVHGTTQCRIEWRVLGQDLFAKSGLAEVLWHNAKIV